MIDPNKITQWHLSTDNLRALADMLDRGARQRSHVEVPIAYMGKDGVMKIEHVRFIMFNGEFICDRGFEMFISPSHGGIVL